MATSSKNRSIYHWKWIIPMWSGFALFDALQTVFTMRAEGMHHNWRTFFAVGFFFWLPWMVVTPLILELGRRFPSTTFKSWRGWLAHFSAALAILVVANAWST